MLLEVNKKGGTTLICQGFEKEGALNCDDPIRAKKRTDSRKKQDQLTGHNAAQGRFMSLSPPSSRFHSVTLIRSTSNLSGVDTVLGTEGCWTMLSRNLRAIVEQVVLDSFIFIFIFHTPAVVFVEKKDDV